MCVCVRVRVLSGSLTLSSYNLVIHALHTFEQCDIVTKTKNTSLLTSEKLSNITHLKKLELGTKVSGRLHEGQLV